MFVEVLALESRLDADSDCACIAWPLPRRDGGQALPCCDAFTAFSAIGAFALFEAP